MDGLDRQVLRQARDWHEAGHRVWLATVIQTWGSAPRPPGALLCLRDDGQVVGPASGGCVEDDLIERLRRGERVEGPSVETYGYPSKRQPDSACRAAALSGSTTSRGMCPARLSPAPCPTTWSASSNWTHTAPWWQSLTIPSSTTWSCWKRFGRRRSMWVGFEEEHAGPKGTPGHV